MKIYKQTFLLFLLICCQGTKEIQKAIFSENYKEPFLLKEGETRIPISKIDIQLADSIFQNGYSDIIVKDGLDWDYNLQDPDRHYQNYTRQYIGYQTSDKNRWIILNLLNFKGIDEDENYPNWKNEFIIGFGEFYEKNTELYHINLSTKRVYKK